MKQYSKEFREQALELSDEIGLKKASEQLGVVYGTLSDWRKKRGKQENESLRKSNLILKDALCFFVEDRKK
jgi:transposase